MIHVSDAISVDEKKSMGGVHTPLHDDASSGPSNTMNIGAPTHSLTVKPCLYTTKIVRGLFGSSIGLVLDSFTCSYKRYSGRLYITSKAVCFFSNMFGFEKKFILWLMDTVTVSKTRKTSILLQLGTTADAAIAVAAVTTQTHTTTAATVDAVDVSKKHNNNNNNISKDRKQETDEEDDANSSSHYKFFMDDVEDADGPKSSDEDYDDDYIDKGHDELETNSVSRKKMNREANNSVNTGKIITSSPTNRTTHTPIIIADDNDKSMYIFRNIQDRDRVVLLVQLLTSRLHQNIHNNNDNQDSQSFSESSTKSIIQNQLPSCHTYSTPSNAMTFRETPSNDISNYEPLRESSWSNQEGATLITNTHSGKTTTLPRNTSNRRIIHRRKLSRSRSVTPYRHYPTYNNLTSSTTLDDVYNNNNNTTLSNRHRFWSEWVVSKGEENDDIMEADTSMFLSKDILSNTDVTTTHSHSNHKELERNGRLWMHKKKLFFALEHVAITPPQAIIPCSLHDFFTWFLSDSAIYPIHLFLTQVIQDANVRTSSWTDVVATSLISKSSSSSFEKTRILTLDHRLKSNFGPSHAATTRTQICTYIQNQGLCIQEKTQISGAPAADCFYVETIWILEPTTASDDDTSSFSVDTKSLNTITFQVRFQIHFVKGTIFKSIILSMTKSETENWFSSYIKIVKTKCLEQNGGLPEATNQYSTTTPSLDSHPKNKKDRTMTAHCVDRMDGSKAVVKQGHWLLMILISLMILILISCLFFIHHIYTKINELEKEMLQLRQACKIDT